MEASVQYVTCLTSRSSVRVLNHPGCGSAYKPVVVTCTTCTHILSQASANASDYGASHIPRRSAPSNNMSEGSSAQYYSQGQPATGRYFICVHCDDGTDRPIGVLDKPISDSPNPYNIVILLPGELAPTVCSMPHSFAIATMLHDISVIHLLVETSGSHEKWSALPCRICEESNSGDEGRCSWGSPCRRRSRNG